MKNETLDNGGGELELLQRWRCGDSVARDELITKLLTWLHEEVRRVLGSATPGHLESMDFVQESALDFLVWGPKFVPRTGGELRSLLRRIAVNKVIDARRRAARRGPHLESVLGGSSAYSSFGPPDSSSARPSRAAERDEESRWVQLAVQFLEPEDRELLLASEVEGHSWAAIADALSMSSGDAVRMRASRLKVALARILGRLKRGQLPEEPRHDAESGS